MLQRVGLGQALIHQPKFLILDEPMSGLDPDGRFQVSELIRELGEGGTTIFFSSHLLDDVERLCDRLVVIDQGKVYFNGKKNEFMKGSESGFEVTYTEKDQSLLIKKLVPNVAAVVDLLSQLEKSSARLIAVREPKISLEEAFNKLKREVAQL
jgi:ABC-2 type transport system ATP-binding protein